jgi:ABC-type transport system involved in cytochrome c biogenesis permease subunit
VTLFCSNFVVGLALTIYGQLLLFSLPALKARNWRLLSILSAISLVALVGFSRIALGAMLAAILFGIIWLALCVVLSRPIQRGSLRSEAAVIFLEDNEPVLVPVKRVTQRDSNF